MKLKLIFIFICLCLSEPAYAIQAHGGSEGIIVHQLGHIFFLLSLCAFVYWLRDKWFLKGKSKRYFQLFGVFLILWNLDVVLMHYLDEQLELVDVSRNGFVYLIQSSNNSGFIEYLYYLGKMDHFLCVPALYFLYSGLKYLDLEKKQG
ncbi:MAG: hypothetical protein ACQEQS_00840 [Thermodesulfobacteriota bacterium]